jgi:hypothetical protein
MQPIEALPAYSRLNRVQKAETKARRSLTVTLMILIAGPMCAHAQLAQNPGSADPTEIVWRMVAENETRAQQLRYYTSCRHYHLEFRGLGRGIWADMHVQVSYTAGSGKTFHVIDEAGSHLLLNHVLLKLLETEQEDSLQRKAALTPFNYKFTFDSQTNEGGRLLYVFSVAPKVKNKLLYRGRIWVDARDFAVVRVEAQPAETPSFWIKQTEIHHVYAKNGDFWLPQSNRSESKIRLGGSAVLTIDYGTYQFEMPKETTPTAAAELAAHNLPPDVR